MILRVIFTLILLIGIAPCSYGIDITENVNYTVRLGYNIGGTAPIGLPPAIRSIDKYKIESNISLSFDGQKDMWGHWGLLTGLHLENKGMEIDARVKSYHMYLEQGEEGWFGYFTGHNKTHVEEWLVTVPVMLTYRPYPKVLLKFGPYLSYVLSRKFEGEAYDGYIRVNFPTGMKVDIGNTESERATFDFSSYMRRLQFGLDIGVDWRIWRRWGLYADLAWGLTGVHKHSFHLLDQTLYPIFGTVGLAFRLK